MNTTHGNPEPNQTLALLLDEALKLHEQGAVDPAELLYKQILSIEPNHFTATHCLGVIQSQRGEYEEAVRLIGEALRLNPRSAMAHLNMGIALGRLNRPQEALTHYQYSLVLNSNNPDAYMNRAIALHTLQRHDEALANYDRALALQPNFALAHSNKIFVLDFIPHLGFEALQQERRRFFQMQARDLQGAPTAFANSRDPARRLVLGYVSADFRRHSAATCFGPVLRHHQKEQFRIICYSGGRLEDDWTDQFRQLSDVWRPTAELSDDELAAQIRTDGVDILIDLSGHTEGNRLLVFARKPAPVQVTAWGHGGGTGLPMVDYQFTDPVHIPPLVRPLFAEASYDLPCCITFESPTDCSPVGDLPALSKGHVTYGSINRVIKMTPAAQALWARILLAVPGSRLLLKDANFDAAHHRESLLATFADLGIEAGRIKLRGFTSHEEHLATCGEVDIMLDTFPQNGGITTWESLWMGVPVVTMLGNKPASRIAGAILHALGLDEWIAENEEDYLRLAVGRALDRPSLALLRKGIRARIEASPAGNAELYTRAVEGAYRTMWKQWLDRNP